MSATAGRQWHVRDDLIIFVLFSLSFLSLFSPIPSLLAVDSADREHEEKCHDYRENGVFGENESKSKLKIVHANFFVYIS